MIKNRDSGTAIMLLQRFDFVKQILITKESVKDFLTCTIEVYENLDLEDMWLI